MTSKTYIKIAIALAILSVICLTISMNLSKKKNIDPAKESALVREMVSKHQILLTHHADFKEHTSLEGASAFLIEYDHKRYAVTARHLIGSDGGVEPEIKATELSRYFDKWLLYPRVPVHEATDTVRVSRPGLDYSRLSRDILMLQIDSGAYDIQPLKVNFVMPEKGDKLYIIGCPYSEPDCHQNVYEITYTDFFIKTSQLVCTMKDKFTVRGFSGAPVVDRNGEVVGVLTSGGEYENQMIVAATSIREIQTMK